MWSFTIGAFWLFFLFVWASFMIMALPTDKALVWTYKVWSNVPNFESSSIAARKLVYENLVRNSSTLQIIPVIGQVKFSLI